MNKTSKLLCVVAVTVDILTVQFSYAVEADTSSQTNLFGKTSAQTTSKPLSPPPKTLILAGFHRDIAAVERLLQSGEDINAQDRNGHTALSNAVASSDEQGLAILDMLLANGAKPNIPDHKGKTPLFKACLHGNLAAVKRLIEHGAEVNLHDRLLGQTPLHVAAQKDSVEIVAYLLDHGANINARTRTGDTPLSTAKGIGRPEVAEFLLSRGAK